jgi:putative two-component system response regulator
MPLACSRDQTDEKTILVSGATPEAHLAYLQALDSHRLLAAGDSRELLSRLWNERVDLILLDGTTEAAQALEHCRLIRADRRIRPTPILLLTTDDNPAVDLAGAECGVYDCLAAPFPLQALRAQVGAMLCYQHSMDRLEHSETLLFSLAQAVEQRDQYTARHCERLALFSVALGIAMNLPRTGILALHRGGYLHDIGKVGMPDSVLSKPGPLTGIEWDLMRTHSERGEQICRPMQCLEQVLPIIRAHHERWDGSGYPDGLRGQEIPLLAQIVQLADIFDALTTPRPYKPSYTTQEALTTMWRETHQGWRNPDLMHLFFRLPLNELRDTASRLSTECQDADAMQRSLMSLHLAVG